MAPEGSVIKSTAIDPSVVDEDGVYRNTGPARIFRSERDAIGAIKSRGDDRIRAGDIMVLTCCGPLGTGMEEVYQITAALKHLSYGKHVALITDARFSGVSTGACIGHVGPEALAGGTIGKVREGDLVNIEIDRINLEGRIDLVGIGGVEYGREWGEAELARRATPDDLAPHPRPAGRFPPVGGAPGRKRRNMGRLHFRRRPDHRNAGRRARGYQPVGAIANRTSKVRRVQRYSELRPYPRPTPGPRAFAGATMERRLPHPSFPTLTGNPKSGGGNRRARPLCAPALRPGVDGVNGQIHRSRSSRNSSTLSV